MQKTSLKKSLVSVLGGQVLIYALSLIQVPYLARHLSPEGFGIFSFAALMFTFGLNFIVYGVNNSGVYLFRKHHGSLLRRSLVFWNQLATQLILATVGALILGAALLFNDEMHAHAAAYGMIALSFVTNALYNPWIFVATERFHVMTAANIVMRAGSLLLVIMLVRDPGDVFQAVLALVLPAVVTTLVFLWWSFHNRIIRAVPLSMINPLKVLRRDASVAGSAYVALLNSYIGMALAKFILNDHDYGLLSFGDRFRWISIVAISMVGSVLFSRYCGERASSVDLGARFGLKSATALAASGLAIATTIAIAVHPLTLVLGGQKFLPAQPVVLLVALAVPFFGLNYYLTTFVINVFGMASRQLMVLLATSALIAGGIYFVPAPTAVEIMSIITAGEIMRTLLSLLIIRIAGHRPFQPGLIRTSLKTAV